MQKFRLQLVKENQEEYEDRKYITSSVTAGKIFDEIFELSNQCEEVFVMVALSTKNEVIGSFEVSRGGINSSIIDMRSIMKRLLLANASRFMVAHNHPSGDTTPSPQDKLMTEKMRDAGKLLNMDLLDHIIIGDDHLSLRSEYPELF